MVEVVAMRWFRRPRPRETARVVAVPSNPELLGTIVCNGASIPIVDVRLRDSQVWFVGHGRMEHDVDLTGPLTLFGEDGRGLMQGSHLDMGYIPAGQWVTVSASYRNLRLVDE
jgi:hypothetical protein